MEANNREFSIQDLQELWNRPERTGSDTIKIAFRRYTGEENGIPLEVILDEARIFSSKALVYRKSRHIRQLNGAFINEDKSTVTITFTTANNMPAFATFKFNKSHRPLLTYRRIDPAKTDSKPTQGPSLYQTRQVFTRKVWFQGLEKHRANLPNLDVPNLRAVSRNLDRHRFGLWLNDQIISVDGPINIWYEYIHPRSPLLQDAYRLPVFEISNTDNP